MTCKFNLLFICQKLRGSANFVAFEFDSASLFVGLFGKNRDMDLLRGLIMINTTVYLLLSLTNIKFVCIMQEQGYCSLSTP